MKHNRFTSNRVAGDSLQLRQVEWRTWYEGSAERIANFYSTWLNIHTANGRFWAALDSNERAEQIHVPIASDIASTSANMLFSGPVTVDSGANQTRMDETLQWNKLQRRLSQAAEVAAAMGGVYLKVDSADDVGVPVISIRYPDMTEGFFHVNGDLKSVIFSRQFIEGDENFVLFETRTTEGDDLIIKYQLHKLSSSGALGKALSLSQTAETENLKSETRARNFGGLGAVYIPNALPNKMFLESNEGICDFAQTIPLMDALDEAYSAWMNDVTLGRGRVFVDEELLNTTDKDKRRFDPYQRAMTKVQMTNTGDMNKMPIEVVQFAIRAEEYRKTTQDLAERIVSMSGYAPQSFGLQVDGRVPESGTALRLRERKSTITRNKKAWYWKQGLEQFLLEVQRFDNLFLNTQISPVRPTVELSEHQIQDKKEESEVARNLRQADAISTEQVVREVHPEMGEDDIQAEVRRIQGELGETVSEEQIGG